MDVLAESRAAVLARMVTQTTERKLGRTQVMKLFYFLQELKGVPLGYDFRLFTYGPFDSEVLSDLATACGQDVVTEKTVIYPKGYGYENSPGPQAERLSRELERTNSALATQVDEVVRDFGAFSASELELRSTILFVDRELSQLGSTTTGRDLAGRVHAIKPHFTVTMILDRIKAMQDKGWLVSLGTSANDAQPYQAI